MAKNKINLESALKLGKTEEDNKLEDMVKQLSTKKVEEHREQKKVEKPKAKKVKEKKTKRITFDVTDKVHIKVKKKAIDRGITVKEFMTELIDQYLDKM